MKDFNEIVKQKKDQGTANYLGKEIREICGMVESEQCHIPVVVESACICDEMRKKKVDSYYCHACKTDWV